jgi:hypothetical protein
MAVRRVTGSPFKISGFSASGRDRRPRPGLSKASHFQLVAALQVENLAGFVRSRDLKPEAFDDLAGERDLLGVRGRHPAGVAHSEPTRTLPPIAAIGS